MPATPATTEELDQLISTPSDAVLATLRRSEGTFAVLGAGGKMGFHLASMLRTALTQLGRSNAVTTISRFADCNVRAKFEQAGFQVIGADISDPNEVQRLPLFDHVFFLAGVKFGASHQPEMLHRMNVLMPQLVASHYRRSQIVALSTGCVYSFTTPESGGSTEEGATHPPGAYAESCKGREAAFQAAAHDFGTRSALIRLNYSIDLRYGVLLDIGRKVFDGQPVNVEMGYANVIWQGDAIARIIQTLPFVDSPPFILNVTRSEVLKVRDIAAAFGNLFGKPALIEGIEQPTAWLNNAGLSDRMFGRPSVSLEQMLRWTADWIRKGGETWNKPTHFEVRDGDY